MKRLTLRLMHSIYLLISLSIILAVAAVIIFWVDCQLFLERRKPKDKSTKYKYFRELFDLTVHHDYN